MRAQKEKDYIATKIMRYLEQGRSVRQAAAYLHVSYSTAMIYLREKYGDNAGRRHNKLPNGHCTRCGRPPTRRDAGFLTAIRDKETGELEYLCSDCLNQTEEQDNAELKKNFLEANYRGSAFDAVHQVQSTPNKPH